MADSSVSLKKNAYRIQGRSLDLSANLLWLRIEEGWLSGDESKKMARSGEDSTWLGEEPKLTQSAVGSDYSPKGGRQLEQTSAEGGCIGESLKGEMRHRDSANRD